MRATATHGRRATIRSMIGPSVPRLWCPPITHYTPAGDIDVARMEAHWRTMVGHVGGFLVPGSTGDGWDMDEDEIAKTLNVAMDLAVALDTRLLVGVLRTDVAAMLDVMGATLDAIKAAAGSEDPLTAMRERHVAGFTICPPEGSELSQKAIRAGLERVLNLGLPTALYQLPQVTHNEIAPATFQDLAHRYPNLLLFKDTSGDDRVPMADAGESGVILVRGAEGRYAHWLKETGGCYDGLLLSSANGLAAELAQMIDLLESGALAAAAALSGRITAAVSAAFDAVANIPVGNAFANANKAIDHVRAYGPSAIAATPPLLHAGTRLPQTVVAEVSDILRTQGLIPESGYL